MENAKKYSFINLKQCQGKNSNYTGVTLEVLMKGPGEARKVGKVGGEKYVVSYRVPINNQGKRIEKMCGLKPYENAEGTCWARVSFWDKTAERVENFMAKHPTCVLIITGSIKTSKSEGDDGRTFINVDITADDFYFVRDVSKRSNNGSGNGNASSGSNANATPNPVNNSTPQQQSGSRYGYNSSFAEFTDIDDDNQELPF